MTTGTDNREATAEEALQPESAPAGIAQSPQTPSEAVEPSADELKAENARLKATLKAMEGRVSRGGDPELRGHVNEIRLALRDLQFREERRAIRESDLPEAEQAQRLAGVEQREKQTKESQTLAEWQESTLNKMVRYLASSKIPADDPKVTEFSDRWVAATTRAQAEKVEEEFLEFLISEPAARERAAATAALKKAEDARKRQNQEDGTLQAGVDRGAPGGGPSYADIFKSGKPLPSSKEIDAMTAKYLR